ncbi:MAG: 23S rRNA (pseudouridine(1915)-N(3))-methyltransferase RlmH [Flavobacteriales bacterium]|nr:23S rRNA (pseudouridine(1915)-N(3))-methyltransferase RlmH [Flavobacteriales bacterium]|tara:strand:- start:706 stop:1179 length:474 start_codon:yes stop_codon:yes gene_type:complete
MKIVLLVVGKTSKQYLIDGISEYQKRLQHYIGFEILEIPNIKKAKNISNVELIKKEGESILNTLHSSDYLVLLDEQGKDFTSLKFSQKLQGWMLSGKKRLVFVVGGAYGFSEEIYIRGDEKLSLSNMTFSHQMVRLFLVEQIYRGYTILNNEPYHHK